MKKVLILAYYFPPTGGVPVIRVYKHVKYLRQFGWEPVVLTIDHKHSVVRDEEMMNELPDDLLVYRTKADRLQNLIAILRHRLSYKRESDQQRPDQPRPLRHGDPIYLIEIDTRRTYGRVDNRNDRFNMLS